MTYKAVFLDKDNTLIDDIPYNVNPALITLKPGAIAGLRLLQDKGFKLIIISNQAGVAKGYFREEALADVERRICELLMEYGIHLTGFYYCPHHPEGSVADYAIACHCRKPLPGMLIEAAEKHHVDLSESWMVGDILNDVEAGNRAGCRTILIDNGGETEWIKDNEYREPEQVFNNLAYAAHYIATALPKKRSA
ncbi:HAD family hydrolase [Mucilaginibacter sp. RS28]|uniref:D,D-heptose 1,7-bisphosphate phosphatase n=1 Tax=Mucilaginibacter straminoryzae TaxID=2932774 RepID=A0A9X1X138_9SPHI|nr:HAD family hydrolase [Mucilaginibacter straminoryzae]MCJ8208686.1 HAD family hydrolase [Mucilaginibacter straminoryzae]